MKLTKLCLILVAIAGNCASAQESPEQAAELNEQRVKIETQMREAERQLAEAARKIAELSRRNLPRAAPDIEMLMEYSTTPRLGVTLGGGVDEGPVEGVTLTGITPGSAAEEAGLRAGDVITAINGTSLSADGVQGANEKLIEFMSGVNEGDTLEIEYLRGENVGVLGLVPRAQPQAFMFQGGPGERFEIFGQGEHDILVAPQVDQEFFFRGGMHFSRRAWNDMELVELTAGLGRYFGTDTGLLVISVSEDNELQLQDGDVIKSVDDREPDSVGHLMRILASYEAGESLELRIVRDKKRESIKLEMPAERIGMRFPAVPLVPIPAQAPVEPPAVDPYSANIRT